LVFASALTRPIRCASVDAASERSLRCRASASPNSTPPPSSARPVSHCTVMTAWASWSWLDRRRSSATRPCTSTSWSMPASTGPAASGSSWSASRCTANVSPRRSARTSCSPSRSTAATCGRSAATSARSSDTSRVAW
jgi:hypothetical protein